VEGLRHEASWVSWNTLKDVGVHEYLRLKALSQYIPLSHRKPEDNKKRKQQTQATNSNKRRK
jgi:hypothetical protein